MKRTFRYRLCPTGKQVRALERTLNLCRILYHCALLDRREHYQRTGKGLSYKDQAARLVQDKHLHPILLEVHSQVLQDVLRRVDRAFENFFRRLAKGTKKPGYPRFKGEGRYDSITYPQSPGFQITPEGRLRLSKIGWRHSSDPSSCVQGGRRGPQPQEGQYMGQPPVRKGR